MSLIMEEIQEVPLSIHPKTPVLIVAATKWETIPLAKALALTASGNGRWSGRINGRSITLLQTGIGAKKTAASLASLDSPSDFGLTISAGLCGAMQPELKTGHRVADAREAELDLVVSLRETAAALALPFHFGKILHTNIVLAPAAKRALGAEQRAVACDMETAALRRWADGKATAIAVRVVLDEIDESIPADAPEGENAVSLARYALTHAASLPSLILTGWRSSRAMKVLSRYIVKYLESI